jgi:uncharacterized membrane protein
MLAKLAGLTIAATGAAHFIVPDAFVAITKPAFPDDTAGAIKQNGATEVAIGLAVFLPATRKLGVAGLLAYTGWLGFNAANAAK